MSNPHNAHYHNKIKTLENTIQQLEGRIRILNAGRKTELSPAEAAIKDVLYLYNCQPWTERGSERYKDIEQIVKRYQKAKSAGECQEPHERIN